MVAAKFFEETFDRLGRRVKDAYNGAMSSSYTGLESFEAKTFTVIYDENILFKMTLYFGLPNILNKEYLDFVFSWTLQIQS